ncbi:protein-glutamine gamma-glutamyltransferase [Clostridium sp. SYSU_GA19001]|uniref:protein-glutamine gamma-glutamyltransferase n=1 Tax=Clostridium caldaquaticum TaxID=2940653 RepID=UPI00207731E5|nr:protein-glutamine gamma-glutamyltransferase [Clostridium caldaquaticum]
MIKILGKVIDGSTIANEFPKDSIEVKIINILSSSSEIYKYSSLNELKFEINMRINIINTAKTLYKSDFKFKTFEDSFCNNEYWERTENGGFLQKESVKTSDAINDIFKNSSKYGTECATAMVIIYYKAILEIYPDELFNETFQKIFLISWHYLDDDLDILVYKNKADYLPGDYRYFSNPDFNPETPEWRGENVIDLGDGTYYGHGIGIKSAEDMIKTLNKHRKKDSVTSAFLMDITGYPNFKYLAALYYNYLEKMRYEWNL